MLTRRRKHQGDYIHLLLINGIEVDGMRERGEQNQWRRQVRNGCVRNSYTVSNSRRAKRLPVHDQATDLTRRMAASVGRYFCQFVKKFSFSDSGNSPEYNGFLQEFGDRFLGH